MRKGLRRAHSPLCHHTRLSLWVVCVLRLPSGPPWAVGHPHKRTVVWRAGGEQPRPRDSAQSPCWAGGPNSFHSTWGWMERTGASVPRAQRPWCTQGVRTLRAGALPPTPGLAALGSEGVQQPGLGCRMWLCLVKEGSCPAVWAPGCEQGPGPGGNRWIFSQNHTSVCGRGGLRTGRVGLGHLSPFGATQ